MNTDPPPMPDRLRCLSEWFVGNRSEFAYESDEDTASFLLEAAASLAELTTELREAKEVIEAARDVAEPPATDGWIGPFNAAVNRLVDALAAYDNHARAANT